VSGTFFEEFFLLMNSYNDTYGINCYECAGILDADNVSRCVEITVLDIDSIVHKA